MSDLDKITEKLEQWTECKGAIMYGIDGNFCSGGDLKLEKKMNNPSNGYAMTIYMSHILDKLKKLPIITVAYIDGYGNIIILLHLFFRKLFEKKMNYISIETIFLYLLCLLSQWFL